VISVVVPARDAADVISGQLEALAAQEAPEPFEVIVVDNGSADATAEVARSWSDRIQSLRVLDASDRAGVNHARNVGAAAATGRHLLFCDADDEVAPGWVAAMSLALEDVEAVGGRLDRRRLNPPEALRPGVTVADGLTPWPGFLPFASGASFGVRTEVLASVGGFDESFSAGGDDVELSWRLQLAGHRLGFAEHAIVHYRERSGVLAIARQAYGYGMQDPVLFRAFARSGMPRPGLLAALRSWAHLVLLAPWYALSAPRRAQWVRSLGRRAGRLVGTVRSGTRYL
jgi:GT2 family glycosyltransferase